MCCRRSTYGKAVELGIVTFGLIRVQAKFQSAELISPPVLEANGDMPLGAIIMRGLDLLDARRRAATAPWATVDQPPRRSPSRASGSAPPGGP